MNTQTYQLCHSVCDKLDKGRHRLKKPKLLVKHYEDTKSILGFKYYIKPKYQSFLQKDSNYISIKYAKNYTA